jgi:hypothetical protein
MIWAQLCAILTQCGEALDISCKSETIEWVWGLAAGIPGILTNILSTCLDLLYRVMNHDYQRFVDWIMWTLWSLPIIMLIIIPGYHYWKGKNRVFNWMLLLLQMIFFVWC